MYDSFNLRFRIAKKEPPPKSSFLLDLSSSFTLYLTLAHRRPTFTADMTIYYCPNMEEALRRAKKAELAGERGIRGIDAFG